MNIDNKYCIDNKFDIGLFVYFSVMFCFYTNTYIQVAIQMFLIAYVIISKMRNKYFIYNKDVRNLLMYFFWIGLLFALAIVSRKWAYQRVTDQKTTITLFRAFIMGACLVFHINTHEKLQNGLKSLIYAGIFLFVVALLTSPISSYGKAGDEGFGIKIGQHRNQVGLLSSFVCFLSYYLGRFYRFKLGRVTFLISVITLFVTSSRASIIQTIFMFLLSSLSYGSIKIRVEKLFVFAFAFSFSLLIVYEVPFLKENVFDRFISSFDTIKGGDSDSSTAGRMSYISLALEMFINRPILGYGVDGFISYFRNNPIINGVRFTSFSYSHCNFAELLADFGIVGFIVWYWCIVYIAGKSYLNRENELCKFAFIAVVSLTIMDFARINWVTHLSIYIFTFLFLIARVEKKTYESKEIAKEKYCI